MSPASTSAIPTPTAYGSSAKPRPGRAFTYVVDPDLVMVLEDQAGSHGLPMNEYMQKAITEALRIYLGL